MCNEWKSGRKELKRNKKSSVYGVSPQMRGYASLVPESRKLLGEWFAARNIKAWK